MAQRAMTVGFQPQIASFEAKWSASRRLKVVSLAHSAVSEGSGRLRYEPLTRERTIELTLVVPARWREYGRNIPIDPPSTGFPIHIQPIRLPDVGPAKWYLYHYCGLGRLLDQLAPEVLHLWEEPWSAAAVQAAYIRQRHFPRTAFVLETDQNILRRLPTPFEQARRYTLRHTDMLIVRQPEALSVCRACGYQGPSTIVEYCVDTSRFYPADRDGARRDYGATGFTLGYVGRLVAAKGLFLVLDALKACRQDVRLMLLGGGPDRETLDLHTRRLGLERRVSFLPTCTPKQVAHFMNALDVLVLMSLTTHTWTEQFGRVIIEAQACGVPVIGSTSGSIPSVIGQGGWIVPPSDPSALAGLLDWLAVNPSAVAGAAEKGLRQVTERYCPDVVSLDLRRAFLEAARQRSQRVNSAR